jgi:hypothetical protein
MWPTLSSGYLSAWQHYFPFIAPGVFRLPLKDASERGRRLFARCEMALKNPDEDPRAGRLRFIRAGMS